MTHENTTEFSPKTYARVAGFLYLLIIICGLFSELYVRSSLIVTGNATLTATNIMANDGLFRIGFISDLMMLLCDIALAVVFYALLKPVNQTLALGAALSRMAMDATLGINLLNHFFALILLGGAEYLTAFDSNQIHALVSLFLDAHGTGYAIGLTFFAFHCIVLSYLFYRSDYFPKALGVLLAFASVSYLVDCFAIFLFPGYETADYPFIMLPALIAEVSLCLWLLLKGVRTQPSQKLHSNESAHQTTGTSNQAG